MSAHQRYLEAPYEDAAREERAFEHWSENKAKAVYDELVETAAIAFDSPGSYDQEEQTYPGFGEWLEGRQAEREFEAWMNRRPETPWTFGYDAFSEFG